MSTVAKVFIVLNLVFVVIFVGFSAALLAKQENWYHKYQDLKETTNKDADQAKKDINLLQSKNSTAEAQSTSFRSENERLKSEIRSKDEEMKNIEGKWQTVVAELKVLREKYDVLGADLEGQRAANEKLNQEYNRIKDERDESVKVREQVTDDNQRLGKDLQDTKVTLDEIEKRYVSLAKKNQENENIIATYLSKLKLRIPEELVKAPAISGRVVGVSDKYNLVMLSVGENDQVKPGYEFTIYRGKDYVAKVRVDKVFADMSACYAIEEYQKQKIQQGDSASNRVE